MKRVSKTGRPLLVGFLLSASMHAAFMFGGYHDASAEVQSTRSRAAAVAVVPLAPLTPLPASATETAVVDAPHPLATLDESIRRVSHNQVPNSVTSVEADEYTAADGLSERPMPHEDILVTYPEVSEQFGVVKAVLTLFIDQRGAVDRVTVENPELPAQFAKAALDAFSHATFRPGMIADRAVKSRVRIEVTFESAMPLE